jgi:hypothetical protein
VVFDKALRTPAGSVKTEQQKEAAQQQDVGLVEAEATKAKFMVYDGT